MEEKNGKIVILNTDFVIKVFSQILQLTHSKKMGGLVNYGLCLMCPNI